MASMNGVAKKVLSLLQGNGFEIQMFDADGNATVVDGEARRFFVMKPNIIVTVNDPVIDDEGKTIPANIEFNIGKDSASDKSVSNVADKIKNVIAGPAQINFTRDIIGKTIQPKDYAYQAKTKKEPAMMENANVNVNSQLMGQIEHLLTKTGTGATVSALTREIRGSNLKDVQRAANKLVQDGKLSVQGTNAADGSPIYVISMEEAIMEVSNELLGRYKKGAAADAGASDKKGDYKHADKRFSGIIKATKKQFKNDDVAYKAKEAGKASADYKKKHAPVAETVKESFSKMFGSARTSQQTLENVVIKVRHKTPVNEESRGARTRHIAAIFLECNDERFRFPYNSLSGARAMAQHMAHGGLMNDKVGAYIAESTGNLLKLQSFNRYVTTNKLINEDSSGIVDTVKENIETIRTDLKKLTGVKTYETVKARIETFEREQLAEDDVSQLKDLFTIRRFDEKFEEVLPIVKQLVQEKDTFHKRIEEAAGNSIVLRREVIGATPMFEFASENARLGFKISELALRITENDELAGFIGKIGTKLCKEGVVNDFEKAVLSQVFENAKIEEKKEKEKKEIKESYYLEAFFDKFEYTTM
jgi:hypothetical protein